MAFLQQKHPVETTERKLKKFFSQNLFFAFLLAAAAIIFCIISESRYELAGRQQLELNQFYHEFEEIHEELYTYTSGINPSLEDSIITHLDNLKDSIEFLKGLPISVVYQRDIEDVRNMLCNYATCTEEILAYGKLSFSDLRELSWISKMNQSYYNAQEIYQSINAEFRGLYSQILEFARIEMERNKIRNRMFICCITAVLFFMMFGELFYSILLSRSITEPIRELSLSIQKFNMQKLENCQPVSLISESNEEMNILVGFFNIMIQTIQEQFVKIQENAKTTIRLNQKEMENLRITNLLRSSELKTLQMQINPHFLFNTLNMISQTAYIEGADTTSQLLDSTASLLRYTLDFSTRAVSLSKEMEYLGIYVSLQEQRFGGRIQFSFDLDESFHNIQVPALILQPLVENSITHGLGMYLKDAMVLIRTEYDAENNLGIIRIIDNGVGMTKEKLQSVLAEMKHSSHPEQKIGLSNVYARLHIFFYGRASMEINSIPKIKTEITISLPCSQTCCSEQELNQEG